MTDFSGSNSNLFVNFLLSFYQGGLLPVPNEIISCASKCRRVGSSRLRGNSRKGDLGLLARTCRNILRNLLIFYWYMLQIHMSDVLGGPGMMYHSIMLHFYQLKDCNSFCQVKERTEKKRFLIVPSASCPVEQI